MTAAPQGGLEKILQPLFSSSAKVELGFLFGSLATGKAGPLSDVDLAVLLDSGAQKHDYLEIQLDLISRASELLGFDRVDVAILNEAPPLLQHRVLSDGILLFERHFNSYANYYVRSMGEYLDSGNLRDIFNSHMYSRLRRRTYGGLTEEVRESMVDRDMVEALLAQMESCINTLDGLAKLSYDEFSESTLTVWAAEHGLQLAIQAALDIGTHILADLNEPPAATYKEVFSKLGSRNVIPSEFARRIQPMAGLRNILVHNYIQVDAQRLYGLLNSSLDDLRTFAGHISDMLREPPPDISREQPRAY